MRVIDRSKWGSGPWDNEPDSMSWVDKATGLPCQASRNAFGAWCGYVGVSKGHPLHGVDYDDGRCSDLDAHGGLTFSGTLPGQQDGLWCFGFDCAHLGDDVPFRDMRYVDTEREAAYKDMRFVYNECISLAKQLSSIHGSIQDSEHKLVGHDK